MKRFHVMLMRSSSAEATVLAGSEEEAQAIVLELDLEGGLTYDTKIQVVASDMAELEHVLFERRIGCLVGGHLNLMNMVQRTGLLHSQGRCAATGGQEWFTEC